MTSRKKTKIKWMQSHDGIWGWWRETDVNHPNVTTIAIGPYQSIKDAIQAGQ